MSYPYSTLTLFLLAFILTACGGQVAGGTDVNGNWTGQISGPGGTAPLTLQLTQSDTTVNGTLGLGDEQLRVTGAPAGNLISLSGQDQNGALQLEGGVSGTDMQGTITVTAQNQSATVDFAVVKD